MWKLMKLNKSEHAKFMYKKACKECKEAYKGIAYRNSIIFASKIIQKAFLTLEIKKT